MRDRVQELCRDHGRFPSGHPFLVDHDLTIVLVMATQPLEGIVDSLFSDHETRSQPGLVGRGFSSPDDMDDFGQRRGGHRQEVQQTSRFLWKEDGVALEREVRRMFPLLEEDYPADQMRTSYQQLLEPRQVLQLLGLCADPAEVGQGLVGTAAALDALVTRVAEDDLSISREALRINHNTTPVYRGDAGGEIVRDVDIVGDAEKSEGVVCDRNGLKVSGVMADNATGCTDNVLGEGMSGAIEVGV